MPSPTRRVLRLPQVTQKVGLGRDSVYRGAREGWFPKPIKLSERASGWFEDELDAYLERMAKQRDAQSAAPGSRGPRHNMNEGNAAKDGTPAL